MSNEDAFKRMGTPTMDEADRSEYWTTLTEQIWKAIQRPSPAVNKEEVSQLTERAFRAFYYELWRQASISQERETAAFNLGDGTTVMVDPAENLRGKDS